MIPVVDPDPGRQPHRTARLTRRSFLEYVPGGTIASIYRTPNQARFEPQLVRFFTEQILQGLAYLHSRNIWHRVSASRSGQMLKLTVDQDLKGDNILVDAMGVCKISDFGISKQTCKQ